MKVKDYTRAFMQKIKAAVIPTTPYEVYSTSEIQVGVWTNNKPIYKKTISVGSLPKSTTKSVEHGISNIDEVVDFSCVIKNAQGIGVTLPYVDNETNKIVCGWNNTTVNITTFMDYTTFSGYATIFYTKTTDTANSPKVPTQALVEYSTNEKLVGYWVDGKAIYEKTVSCGALPNNNTKRILHGIANIDTIIDGRGVSSDNSGVALFMPFGTPTTNNNVTLVANKREIVIVTGIDRTLFSTTYVTLRYTKTS